MALSLSLNIYMRCATAEQIKENKKIFLLPLFISTFENERDTQVKEDASLGAGMSRRVAFVCDTHGESNRALWYVTENLPTHSSVCVCVCVL